MSDFEDDNDPNGTGLDRRHFGKILVWSVGGLSLAGVAGGQEPKRPLAATEMPVGEFDVIIVGAGLSGLIAARELCRTRKLEKILILEANDRVGGRMVGEEVTINNKTGYIDYGGQWIGPTQTAMLALLEQLDIKMFTSYEKGQSIQSWKAPGKPLEKTVFNGDVSDLYMGECKAPNDFPLNPSGNPLDSCNPLSFDGACSTNDEERRIWLTELLEKISVTVPCDAPWAAKDARELDGKTFQQFLNENGAKGYTQWLPTVVAHIGGSGGFEPDQVSLLHMAWSQHVAPQSETPEKWLLKGGAGQIPAKLVSELTDRNNVTRVAILTDLPVTQIAIYNNWVAPGDMVAVSVAKGSFKTTYAAKAVIVAIPPPMRQKINFPQLSKDYVGFMYGSPMGSMSKVHFVYENAFWRDQCLSGSAVGNLETVDFIADSSSEGGEPGILTSFIAADRNIGLRHATDDQVRDLVLRDYKQVFGDRALEFKRFFYRNWNNQTWTGGAFTSYASPGVWTRYGSEGWRKPSGLIFWAGTETAERWPGYFDGAIRAGVRAANEVLSKLKLEPPPPLNPPWPKPSCPDKVERVT